jgi:Transglycosylase SLT domain
MMRDRPVVSSRSMPDARRTKPALAPHWTREFKVVTTLLAGASFAQPLLAVAAPVAHSSNSGTSSQVVMMIGGMTNGDVETPHAANVRAPSRTLNADLLHHDPDKLSLVFQPGRSESGATGESSTSVSARVLALAPVVSDVARAARIDDALLMAVIDVESGGNPFAVSPKGATGLMQLMPETGARNGALNLFDPRQNIAAGARYLAQLIQQFGDLQLALAAYNAGEGAVQKYGGQIPPYAETLDYVPRVLQRYWHYRNAVAPVGGVRSEPTGDGFLTVRQRG